MPGVYEASLVALKENRKIKQKYETEAKKNAALRTKRLEL